jgi:hypothetical protein
LAFFNDKLDSKSWLRERTYLVLYGFDGTEEEVYKDIE